MESRIRVLPEELVNKIAAGEVVQSPAAVVKELIENALDAGATHITVVVTDGGKSMIKVVDNGTGMTPEEARIALRRHATSKIASMDDLLSVRTMGFRGEALPSIAGVSRFTITTRPGDSNEAVRVRVDETGMHTEPAAHPPGTTVVVQDLFYNVPARKKFLKSDRYEGSKIQQTVLRYAFARLDCHLVLFKDERKVYDLQPVDGVIDRAVQVFGARIGGSVFPVELDGSMTRVWGFISDPVLARPHPDRMLIFVNNRPVNDRGLRKAVSSAYGPLIMRGRFPTCVIHLQMPPEFVDVNCHPQKTEVKFAGPSRVFETVYAAVHKVVQATPWIKRGGGISPGIAYDNGARGQADHGFGEIETLKQPPVQDRLQDTASLFEAVDNSHTEGQQTAQQSNAFTHFADLHYIGQLGRVILVFEGDNRTVVLIDQHAAHEKVNYERLRKQVMSRSVPVQPLLIPQILNLSPDEMQAFEEAGKGLETVGFDVEANAGDQVVIRAVPQILANRDAAGAIQEMLGIHKQGRKDLDLVIATTACHASIRAGDQVNEQEVRVLLEAMDQTATSSYCPHGRQAVVVIPLDRMLRWFGR